MCYFQWDCRVEVRRKSCWDSGQRGRSLTCMGDWEAVGRLQVVHVVVEMERFLGGVLVGVVQLDREPERAVLLHRGAHEQPPYEWNEGKNKNKKTVSDTWTAPLSCSVYSVSFKMYLFWNKRSTTILYFLQKYTKEYVFNSGFPSRYEMKLLQLFSGHF